MNEVQKYATVTYHGYLGYALIVNQKLWDDLPADIRAQLEKAVADATAYTNDIAQKENDDALEAMKKAGKTEFHVPTAAERKAWIEAMKPVHKEMESRIGRELLQRIYQTTGFAMN
jgi:C4-dicarboxylate-binding protein DctP